jgi:hypothetical protein
MYKTLMYIFNIMGTNYGHVILLLSGFRLIYGGLAHSDHQVMVINAFNRICISQFYL